MEKGADTSKKAYAKKRAAELRTNGLTLSHEGEQRLHKAMRNIAIPVWKEVLAARARQQMH